MLLLIENFLFIAVNYIPWHRCHIFFIYSSINRHLDYFHIVVIANTAAMNMGVLLSLQVSVSFSSGKYPEIAVLDHMVVVF